MAPADSPAALTAARQREAGGDGVRRLLASRGWLVSVLLLAAGLRIAYLVQLRATPWFDHLVVDPEYYDAWARRIAAGDWLGAGAFYMDPLYPYVLGVLYRVAGYDLWLARLLNVACSVGACAGVALLGRRVGGGAVGGLAVLGLALYEPDIFAVGEIDKTSLSMLLVTITLVFGLGRSIPERAAAGFALGLATLTRGNLIVFAPILPLVAPSQPGGRRLAGGIACALGLALAIAPVTGRNLHLTGEWVLTTTQLGQNFYTGNNPENPYGAYGVVSFVRSNPHFEEADFRSVAEERAGRPLTTGETSRFWFGAALAHMAADPAFAARAFGRKLLLLWNDFEISDSQDQYLLERDAWILRLPLLGFGEVVALAALGIVATFRRNRAVRLLTGFVLLYGATLVAFFIFARYRIQVVPALVPLAALGVREVLSRLRAGDVRRLATAAAVVGATAWLSFHTVGHFWRDQPRVVEMRLRHLADIQMDAGHPDRAIAALKEAIPNCTHGCPFALADLFEVYRRSGRAAEGVRYFETFVRDYPRQRDAPAYLSELRAAGR